MLRLVSCADMPAPIPRRNPGMRLSLASPRTAAFPALTSGRLPQLPFRGLNGVHLCSGLSTRRAAKAALSIEGFRGLVTSSTTPIAAGRSDCCQAGLVSR